MTTEDYQLSYHDFILKQVLFYEKLKCVVCFFILIEMWEKLVITLVLFHAGPCKAHGQHVLQPQGYQISQNLLCEN